MQHCSSARPAVKSMTAPRSNTSSTSHISSTVNRWIIILGVGLLLVTVAVFVERQRELLIAKAQEWREALEKWE